MKNENPYLKLAHYILPEEIEASFDLIRNRRSKAGDVKQKCQQSETEKAESSEALALRRMKS